VRSVLYTVIDRDRKYRPWIDRVEIPCFAGISRVCGRVRLMRLMFLQTFPCSMFSFVLY